MSIGESIGMPVGVQVATLPNQDEKCIYVMEIIEKAIGYNDLSIAFIY